MEGLTKFSTMNTIFALVTLWQILPINGQITTPCSGSMMTSFGPCMSYITGSTKNGNSPTSSCCDSVKSLMGNSMDCACLIITGNVPLPSIISQALAVSLPRACGTSIPFQCKSSGVQLPPPGPVLFAPPPPPAAVSPAQSPDLSPVASTSKVSQSLVAMVAASTLAESPYEAQTPSSVDAMAPSTIPRIRPVFTPSTSASGPFYIISSPILIVSIIGIMFFSYY